MSVGTELRTLAYAVLQRADRRGIDVDGGRLGAAGSVHGTGIDTKQAFVVVRKVRDPASVLRPLAPRDGQSETAALGRPPVLSDAFATNCFP